ncbi:hypothetical protein B0H16DRAFT_1209629, partial [Mycena metata]
MALPRDIPTLRAFGTGNFTRPDNVFCSTSLLSLFVKCDTDPAVHPVKTDHFPIVMELDLTVASETFQPRPDFRRTLWPEFREYLLNELQQIERPDEHTTIEDIETAIHQLDKAIDDTIQAVVPMSKPFPHSKRWYTKDLRQMKHASEKLERTAY